MDINTTKVCQIIEKLVGMAPTPGARISSDGSAPHDPESTIRVPGSSSWGNSSRARAI